LARGGGGGGPGGGGWGGGGGWAGGGGWGGVRGFGSWGGLGVAWVGGWGVGGVVSPLGLLQVASLVPHLLASPVATSRTAIAPAVRIAASRTSAQLRAAPFLLVGPALFWVEGVGEKSKGVGQVC
jgi:hypothetical protein